MSGFEKGVTQKVGGPPPRLNGPPIVAAATVNFPALEGVGLADQPAVFAIGDNMGLMATGKVAGRFEGNVAMTAAVSIGQDLAVGGSVVVTGNITLTGPASDITLQNGDCAEQFDLSGGVDSVPGFVMVLDDVGLLRPSHLPYDKRVAGVISGAGSFKPAMTLGVIPSIHERAPIALLGKVCCWVDADIRPIQVGDLLTSSGTVGHAMAASDPVQAFGAIIGKALQPLATGKALIAILVTLQ